MSAAPLLREADFQAAWYFSIVIFVIGALLVGGVLVAEGSVRRMWRAGDRALATLVGTVVGVTGLFFVLLATTVVVALAPAAVGGGR